MVSFKTPQCAPVTTEPFFTSPEFAVFTGVVLAETRLGKSGKAALKPAVVFKNLRLSSILFASLFEVFGVFLQILNDKPPI